MNLPLLIGPMHTELNRSAGIVPAAERMFTIEPLPLAHKVRQFNVTGPVFACYGFRFIISHSTDVRTHGQGKANTFCVGNGNTQLSWFAKRFFFIKLLLASTSSPFVQYAFR